MKQLTQGDENFKQRLSRCTTVKGIFKLLDVPDGEVTPHSAAFALQKLCPLQKGTELYVFWLIQIELGRTLPRLRKFTSIILCGSFHAVTLAVPGPKRMVSQGILVLHGLHMSVHCSCF